MVGLTLYLGLDRYGKMASPMVATGDWSNGDDQRLLERCLSFPWLAQVLRLGCDAVRLLGSGFRGIL